MSSQKKITVIGGGLAGLTTAILLTRRQHSVTVVEKKTYPFHRVCGEYVSNEVVPFLQREGIYPNSLALPSIKKLHLTSTNGKRAEIKLELGGFGISRFAFDDFLYQVAQNEGVEFLLNTEVESVSFRHDHFQVRTQQKEWVTDVAIGSFGKRSKLDRTFNRSFIEKRSPYVGVKYHIETDHPEDTIALHNFQDGYCGISRIENGKANLCYLTHRKNLKAHRTIEQMQEEVLFKNSFLKNIFTNSHFLFDRPEVINEISFETKRPVEQHVLMAGDAAGMITPLCGNGMAMAIHSAKILTDWVHSFCESRSTRTEMEKGYELEWRTQFATRLWVGRQIQRLFGSSTASNFAVQLANNFSPIARFLVNQTHGRPF